MFSHRGVGGHIYKKIIYISDLYNIYHTGMKNV